MEIIFRIFLFVLGACIGSFLCCQVRRLHLRRTKSPAQAKSKSKSATRFAARHSKLPSRSICLHCKKPLQWYDNLPIISWLVLKGKCRHCHKRIGLAEFLSELLTAIAFPLLSLTIDPLTASSLVWVIFIAVLLLTSILIFLAIYDGLYGELPTTCLILAIALAAIILLARSFPIFSTASFTPTLITNPLLSVLILGGLYLLLYLISKGKWVGDGDWLLATAIALALGHPFLALAALFLANFLACLVMLPAMKGNAHAKIHFGPFLVAAFVLTYSFSLYLMMIML